MPRIRRSPQARKKKRVRKNTYTKIRKNPMSLTFTAAGGRSRFVHCQQVEETTEDYRVHFLHDDKKSGQRQMIEIFPKSIWSIKRDLASELAWAQMEIERLKKFTPAVLARASVPLPETNPIPSSGTARAPLPPKPIVGIEEGETEEIVGDVLASQPTEYNAMDPKNWEQEVDLDLDPNMMIEKEVTMREIENKARQRKAARNRRLMAPEIGASFTPDMS
jgi:hypothetical protein